MLHAGQAARRLVVRQLCTSRPLLRKSVTGELYAAANDGAPVVKLFTKDNCPLCDEIRAVLQRCAASEPHTLVAVDITDRDKRAWWDRYKYDIPVLHLNDAYWAKHRIEPEACAAGLAAARAGRFVAQPGEPNAQDFE
eukprot:TRINITY_DN14233_c0_g1_i1.p2 TRINITY_DN14233_c0_g1~~TRINITY_DN14233_c0_g1_i1.p2  ORF type:complete len:148 (+),score=26.54 TRINITY_DN14233_c0_g1_i1:33-446(+)